MKISVVQIKPIKGNVAANIEVHIQWIHVAVQQQAAAVFFPELSITGYEPTLAQTLATHVNDSLFDDFQELSNEHHITIGIGMPLKGMDGIQIAMIIFQPNVPRSSYAKQLLHDDELPFFVNGTEQLMIKVGTINIAPAICYESLQPTHATNAVNMGADMYLASVAKTQAGVDKAKKHFTETAQKYVIPIMMCNCVGYCDNFLSAGHSAVWGKDGGMGAALTAEEEGLIVYDTEKGEIIKMNNF